MNEPFHYMCVFESKIGLRRKKSFSFSNTPTGILTQLHLSALEASLGYGILSDNRNASLGGLTEQDLGPAFSCQFDSNLQQPQEMVFRN